MFILNFSFSLETRSTGVVVYVDQSLSQRRVHPLVRKTRRVLKICETLVERSVPIQTTKILFEHFPFNCTVLKRQKGNDVRQFLSFCRLNTSFGHLLKAPRS